ncbi:tandem large repeat [Vibrio maritimus]
MNKLYLVRILTLLLVIFISSCGGGGEGTDASPNTRKTGTIYGVVFDAPVSGAKVSVWEFRDGKVGRQLGESTTDQLGYYEIDVTTASMPLYVEARGGAYRDPLTDQVITVSNGKSLTMSSVANFAEGSEQPVMVTPLTHMVTGLAEFNVAGGVSMSNAISDALTRFNTMYGFDVNEVRPIDITQGGQSSYAQDGHKYGALLTAYSSYASDLINKYPTEESMTLYTSMHLSDIQYRDIRADGVLDGEEVDANGVAKRINFGQVDINADVYTNHLSQHTLIVVNNPDLNLSGTLAEDYQEFANQINQLGTSSDTTRVVGPRNVQPIDETPPQIVREGVKVLAGADKITLAVSDGVGVNDVTVELELETADGYITKQCLENGGEPYCSLDKSQFKSGKRETKVVVNIDTTELDSIGYTRIDGSAYIQSSQLIVSADDVLGNVHTYEQAARIPFTWDNVAPVITVTSSPTINNSEATYILTGTIVDTESDITNVVISQNDDVRNIECFVSVGEECSFNEAYDATSFGSATRFFIEVTDSHDNISGLNFEVRKDNNLPAQTLSYPNATGAPMAFIKIDTNDNRGDVEYFDYSLNTFNENNIGTTSNHLKVDFNYARSGLLEVHDGIDFQDFNQSALAVLHSNFVPYVKLVVQDEYDPDNGILGSSAEELEVTVKYYVKSPTDNDFQFVDKIESHSGNNQATHAIPHEQIEVNQEGRVSKLTYYIPFVKELLSTEYASTPERSQQKLVITTKDRSGNVSTPKTVYFRTTFDLPTFDIITPFANANVELKGLNTSGKFDSNPVSTCTTKLVEGTLDVATCQLRADLGSYRFLQVQLANPASGKAYYYQWTNDSNQYREVDLSQSNFGAYFDYTNTGDIYITELSAYHTGLFDYIWNNTSNHSNSDAQEYLAEVNSALGSGVSNSFFKFDPIFTRYATNEDLAVIPTFPGDEYKHRFLVESLVDMASENVGYTSTSYATAFYQDLVHDGKANGVGSSGDIFIGSNRISNDTYRKEFASTYYDRLVQHYGLSPQLALSFADIIATANPSIEVEGTSIQIFDSEGGSIDTTPPDISVLPNQDQKYGVYYQNPITQEIFVAGQIDFTAFVSDRSGLSSNPAPVFSPLWRAAGSNTYRNDIVLPIVDGGDNYNKSYSFNFDTLSSSYENIAEFALEITASDTKNNAYTAEEPYFKSFKVDNEFPNVVYKLPDGQAEDAYINVTRQKSLNFVIKDVVGDDANKRQIYFEPKAQGASPILFEGDSVFAINTPSSEFSDGQLVLQLCLTCGEAANKLEDGKWTAYVVAEDILGNRVDQTIEGAPAFTVNVDSTPFVIEEVMSSAVIGGNKTWDPTALFTQDDGSPLGEVKIIYQQDGAPKIELKACEESNDDAACLLGEQPEVIVQLVADNIKNGSVKHYFYVTAIDTAIPVNTSNEGWFQFSVDIVGPEIKVRTPWASDISGNGNGNVIGTQFRVNLQSVQDVSGVKRIEVLQKDDNDNLKLLASEDYGENQPAEGVYLSVYSGDHSTIEPGTNGRVTMVVRATDQHDFKNQTELAPVRFDNQGPEFTLNQFSQESYYYASGEGYPMVLNARDYDDTSIDAITDDGVDKSTISYWVYNGASRPAGAGNVPEGDAKREIPFKATQDSTLEVEAKDIRGNLGSAKFLVKVDNEAPRVEVSEVYSDDTPIEGNVSENKDIKFSILATDISGIKSVIAKYSYEDSQTQTPLTVREEGNDIWSTVLTKDMTKLDGSYSVNFTVEDNVVYPATRFAQNPNTTPISKTLKILRKGVKLTVASPEAFDTYDSSKTLKVTFADPQTEVKITQLECWIRPRSDEDAPQDTDQPYTIVESPPSSGPSCILKGTETIESGATLITRTTAENGATEVQKHSFKSIDVNGPVVKITQGNESTRFQLTQTNVKRDETDNSLSLILPLFISDDLAGVDYVTTGEGSKPVLKVQDDIDFASMPVSCNDPGADGKEVTCSYRANLLDVFGSVSTEKAIYLGDLKDTVGNAPEQQKLITLVRPQGELSLDITSPKSSAYLNGEQLTVQYRYKVYQYSDIDEMLALVDNNTYSSKSPGSVQFKVPQPCEDDGTWMCNEYEYTLQDAEKNRGTLTVGVTVIDSWGVRKTEKFTVSTDNTMPKIKSVDQNGTPYQGVSFDPAIGTPNQEVTVYVEFDEEVTQPVGRLANQTINWATSQETTKALWSGTVTLPTIADEDIEVRLEVQSFFDQAGNEGQLDRSYKLPIRPTITVTSFDSLVNNSNIENVNVSGESARFYGIGQTLDVELRDERNKPFVAQANVLSGGKWGANINLKQSGLADGNVTITVAGTNSLGASADTESDVKTFVLNTVTPTIDADNAIILNTSSGFIEHGKPANIILNFSTPVKDVKAKMGTQSVDFGIETSAAQTWEGTVTPSIGFGEVAQELVVQAGYQTEFGNTGIEAKKEFVAKPVIEAVYQLTGDDRIIPSEAPQVVISGKSYGFANDDTLTVVVQSSQDLTKEATRQASVNFDGKWTTDSFDFTGWPEGAILVKVTGSNIRSVSADEFTYSNAQLASQQPPVLKTVSFNPEYARAGVDVTVTMIFDKPVTNVEAVLGNVPFTVQAAQGTGDTWTGTVPLPLDENRDSVMLTVQNFRDNDGNVGNINTLHSIPYAPEMTMDSIGEVYQDQAANFSLTGTFKHIRRASLDVTLTSVVDRQTVQGSVVLNQTNGTWSVTGLDLTSLPTGDVEIAFSGSVDIEGETINLQDDNSFLPITSSFTLTLTQPVAALSSSTVEAGKFGVVTVDFDEAVSANGLITINNQPTALQLDGATIVATTTSTMTNIETLQDVEIRVTDFKSAKTGNAMQTLVQNEQTIVGVEATTDRSSYNKSQATRAVVSGTTRGVSLGTQVTIQVLNAETDKVEDLRTVAVSNGGTWTTGEWNLSALSGTHVIKAIVTRHGLDTESIGKTVTFNTTAAKLVNAAFIVQNGSGELHAKATEAVSVTLTFDMDVDAVEATLGTKIANLNRNPSDDKIWSGLVEMPEYQGQPLAVLSVSNVIDSVGNSGATNSDYKLAYTPTFTITGLPETVTEAMASSLTISGSQQLIKNAGNLTLQLVSDKGSSTEKKAVVLGSGNTWSVSGFDISNFLGDTVTLHFEGSVVLDNDETASKGFTPQQGSEPSFAIKFEKPTAMVQSSSVEYGTEAQVTIEFGEAMSSDGTVTINNVATNLQANGNVIVATTVEPLNTIQMLENVPLAVQGFTSAVTGNQMRPLEQTIATIIDLEATTTRSIYNKVQASTFVVSGQTFGVPEATEVHVAMWEDGNQQATATNKGVVQSDGTWTTGDWDLSSLSGTYTMKVTLTRSDSAPVEKSKTITFHTQEPSLTAAVFDVQNSNNELHANPGETVNVRLSFSQGMDIVEATLNSSNISLASSNQDKTEWAGSVVMPAHGGQPLATLTVTKMADTHGNEGGTDSTNQLAYTPTLLVENLPASVSGASAKALTLSGRYQFIKNADNLTLELVSQHGDKSGAKSLSLNSVDQTWSVSGFDISAFPEGDVFLTFNGSVVLNNDLTISKGFKPSPLPEFNFSYVPPTATVSDSSIEYDKQGVVTLEFDTQVNATSGWVTINGQTTLLESVDVNRYTATMTTLLGGDRTAVSAEVKVGGFVDATTGKAMVPLTVAEPTLVGITASMNQTTLNKLEASSAVISGLANGVTSNTDVTIEMIPGNGEVVLPKIQVKSDGSWETEPLDLSSLSGEHTMRATVTRNDGLSAFATETLTFNTQAAAIATVAFVNQNGSGELHAKPDDTIDVTITFDADVSSVDAKLGENTLTLTSDQADKKVWTGNVRMPSVGADSLATLSVYNIVDSYGNTGAADTSQKLAFTPTLTIDALPSTVTGEPSKSLDVTGTYKLIKDVDSLALKLVSESGNETLPIPVVLDSVAHTWSASGFDISLFPEGTVKLSFVGGVLLDNDEPASTGYKPNVGEELSFDFIRANPTVSQVTATKILSGEQGEIQIEFGEPVVGGTVTINGLDTDLVGSDTVWTATTIAPLSGIELVETVGIDIQGFTSVDTAKEMDVYSSTLPTDLVISLSLGNTCYGGNNRKSVEVTGAAHGATSGALVRLELLDTGENTVEQMSTTVNGSALWTSGSWNLDGYNDSYRVKATLLRQGMEASSVSEVMQLKKSLLSCW